MLHSLQLLRTKSDLETPDTAWHTAQTTPPALAQLPNAASKALVFFRFVDAEGDVVAFDSTVATVTIVPYATTPAGTTAVIGGSEALADHDLSTPVTVELPPGCSFAVHLSAVTSPHEDADALQVWWIPYRP